MQLRIVLIADHIEIQAVGDTSRHTDKLKEAGFAFSKDIRKGYFASQAEIGWRKSKRLTKEMITDPAKSVITEELRELKSLGLPAPKIVISQLELLTSQAILGLPDGN